MVPRWTRHGARWRRCAYTVARHGTTVATARSHTADAMMQRWAGFKGSHGTGPQWRHHDVTVETARCPAGHGTVPQWQRHDATVATTVATAQCHSGDAMMQRWRHHGATVATARCHCGDAAVLRWRSPGATVATARCNGGRATVPLWRRRDATVVTPALGRLACHRPPCCCAPIHFWRGGLCGGPPMHCGALRLQARSAPRMLALKP